MKLVRLELERFTAFDHAEFEFGPGVNVIIGENATGKSHVLKLIYCLSESIRRYATGDGLANLEFKPALTSVVMAMLAEVFQFEQLGHLVRRGPGERSAKIRATWRDGGSEAAIELEFSAHSQLSIPTSSLPDLKRSVFLPTREVLSIFPGFISSYLKRESAFDRTVFDLCVALDAKPLRTPSELRTRLLAPIEAALGGTIVNEHGRFYLKLPDGGMEAPLVAEGIRKLGMLDYLIANGSLTENGFLLWDEPEASLNPRLTRLIAHIALELAKSGVQTWIATHDYLLTSELALDSEQQALHHTAFFSLDRPAEAESTVVERGDKLADLQHNSILKALTDLHDREQVMFLGDPP